MSNNARAQIVLAVLVLAAGGCRSKNKLRQPVAQIGSETIYLDDVDKDVAPELFELRAPPWTS